MRIGLIFDIHGNKVALQAVLDDIQQVGVDQLVCLGDVATLGPQPCSVIHTLRDLPCSYIVGNHDAFLLDPGLIQTYTQAPMILAAVDWCRGQLSGDELAFLGTFQPTITIALDADSTLLLFHGSPRSYMENLLATTSADEVDQLLDGHHATVLAGGHTHIQMLRQHRGMLIVNPGSVGMPFKEFVSERPPTLLQHAEYALVEATQGAVNITLRRVPLSRTALYAAAAASDTPLRGMLLEQYA